VATDLRYIFKWPELVHFEWPRDEARALKRLVFGRGVLACT
jgi:hypothetical protein